MGEFLSALRKSKGYTQQEVSERLGVSNKTISSWETGASAPDISMLPVLAELYEVTCDEIIRGRKLPADEEISQTKRDKAIRRLLQKQQTNLATVCWISGGLTVLGVLITLLIGYAALESRLALFIGIIFFVASVVTVAIALRRIRFSLGDEWLSGETDKISASLDKALLWIVCANIAAFAFILPHVIAPVHTGLGLDWDWISLELFFGLLGFLLALLIGIPVYLHRCKKRLEHINTEGPSPCSKAHEQAVFQNKLAFWRYKHILLIVLLPALITATAAAILAFIGSSLYYYADVDKTETITCAEEELNAPSGPFLESEYIFLSEEKPQSDTETGKYAVRFFFSEFPEQWRSYYETRNTDTGTIVTIYKYRAKMENSNTILEFYAYQPEYQGGITVLSAIQQFDTESYKIELQISPTLYDQAMQQKTANLQDTFSWCSLGAAVLCILSLSICIPLYIKKERSYRKSL